MSELVALQTGISRFPQLIESRKAWIDSVLEPWCLTASRRDLLLAEHAWPDLAGRPDPDQTLWFWAWKRFESVCELSLRTINETWPVKVVLGDGRLAIGYPESRLSRQGELYLVNVTNGQISGPFCIDEIKSIDRLEDIEP